MNLDEIKAKCEAYRTVIDTYEALDIASDIIHIDIPALIAEVERLNQLLTGKEE